MLRIFGIYQLLFVLSAALCQTCWAEQPLAEGVIEPINVQVRITAADEPAYTPWTRDFEKPSSRFLRLHFSAIADQSTSDYSIVLRDRNWHELRSYTKAEFSSHDQFWSPLIFGDYVSVQIFSSVAPRGLQFGISEMASYAPRFVKYSLVHNPPELEPIMAYQAVPELFVPSHAVAKLVFSANGLSDSCTGFLISNDALLTNQHCIDQEQTCKNNATVIFGYEETPSGTKQGEQFDCIALLKPPDAELDFSLVRVAGNPGSKYGHLELTRRPVSKFEQTFLIQHPAGEPKQIARKECFVSTLNAEAVKPDTDIGHMCDTAGGASGSPLLGKDYKVVGLHHRGFDLVGPWKKENRAVQIGKVMDRLGL